MLTGLSAGQRSPDGKFPENSINALIQNRINELNQLQQEFSAKVKGGKILESTES